MINEADSLSTIANDAGFMYKGRAQDSKIVLSDLIVGKVMKDLKKKKHTKES